MSTLYALDYFVGTKLVDCDLTTECENKMILVEEVNKVRLGVAIGCKVPAHNFHIKEII